MPKWRKSFSPEPSDASGSASGEPRTLKEHLPKKAIVKNLLVVSLAWWTMFSAYDCLIMLQSTLNSDQGIGVISIAVQNAGACVISLVLPKYLLTRLGSKTVILLSMALHLPYIAANFYPQWFLMIFSSVFVCAGNPLIWAAVCAYLNNLSILYTEEILTESRCAKGGTVQKDQDSLDLHTEILGEELSENLSGDLTNRGKSSAITNSTFQNIEICESSTNPTTDQPSNTNSTRSVVLDRTTAQFFGIHGMIYQICHVTGNLVGYFVLRFDNRDLSSSNVTCTCGSYFCNDNVGCLEGNLSVPSNDIRYILLAVCIVFVGISLLIIHFFLDEVKGKDGNVSLDMLLASFKLFRNWDFIFIFPIVFYVGILSGFVVGDYTQAYVGCAWGIHNIALVSAMYGLALVFSSSLCGSFVKYMGRRQIFIFTALLNVATIVLLLLWEPDGEKPAMMFVVAWFLGFILGTYSALTRAFFGALFVEDEETAFGNYQLCFCSGLFLASVYSKYLCTFVKIYILSTISTVAIVGYIIVEHNYSKSDRRRK